MWYTEEKKNNPNLRVVVTDVRFENECECIHELGGIIIKLERNNEMTKDIHSSEQELSKLTCYDHYINNNCDINNLHERLEKIFQG